MNNTALNIHNLSQLWTLAGQAFQGFKEHPGYAISTIDHSEWPNRIWVNNTLSQAIGQAIKSEMAKDDRLTFSHFSEGGNETVRLSELGFALKFSQYGMSLPLNTEFRTERNLDFERVNHEAAAGEWSTAFYEAFRYRISTETIVKTSEGIHYFLVYDQQQLVGTIVLFATGRVMGIHSLGIVPAQRKKGYGKEIMHHVLNLSTEQNFELATLQASEMAKSMYLKMGFSLDFMMENYTQKG